MNILTFDVEEWFHILDNPSTATPKEWANKEYRLDKNMDRILSFLQEKNQKALFCARLGCKRVSAYRKKIG